MVEDLSGLRRACHDATDSGVVPALELLVASGAEVVFHEAFGARQLEPERLSAEVGTVWDVASVTKAVSTSVLAMHLVGRGAVPLDEPARRWLPELASEAKRRITPRLLLAHASGLPPHRPFHRMAAMAPDPRQEMIRLATSEPLEGEPGAVSRYSDLGFITLGALLERASGSRLDALFDQLIARPLGLGATRFVDLSDPGAATRLAAEQPVAATQRCPERRRIIVGEVDDLNAAAMGGAGGHAGLFATAADLHLVARALVAAWQGTDGALPGIERDVIREFWCPAGIPGSTWRLGWDGPAPHGSLAGELLSRRAVGHLGFTGCSLWIDPEQAVWIVLLTNRVHPELRDDPRFRGLRPALHDLALRSIGYQAG